MEKITREHGDLFRNPTTLPEFGVVYHFAAWSYAAHYWRPVVSAMEAYPDIPLYVIDLGSPAYAAFSAASGVESKAKGEVLFVRGGHVLNCYAIGRSREGIQQRVKKELHTLERCRDPEELLFQRIVNLLDTVHGPGDPPDTRATRIEADRGCTGDDAYDLMVAYAETFKVDVSDFQYNDYFHGEGMDPFLGLESLFKWITGGFSPLPNDKKELTVAHLMKGVLAGRLDEAVIWGDQAESDVSHPMEMPCD
jgi:Protein of unknown function (DUF1493)